MANHSLRALMWWRKLAKREWTIPATGFALLLIFIFSLSFGSQSNTSSILNQPSEFSGSDLVPLTLLANAQEKGALCLDGSPPGYHFQKGFGSGADSWILHIEGGGWCNSLSSCSYRKNTALGSSKYMVHQVPFSGIFSRDPSQNPDFFNWNKVKVRYCDGASLAGHPESEPKNGTKLFFRGQLIWEALMEELLPAGLSNARQERCCRETYYGILLSRCF